MSKAAGSRLLSALTPSICASCRAKLLPIPASTSLLRPFSSTPHRPANPPSRDSSTLLSSLASEFSASRPQPQRNPAPNAYTTTGTRNTTAYDIEQIFSGKDFPSSIEPPSVLPTEKPPHHLHIYATKHNTHITLTRPDRNPIISFSAGNIGFRKAGRGSYDAAYQLAAFFMKKIQDQGLLRDITRLEVALRGYGPGREAVTKVLLGSEGRMIRGKVVKVTDQTRLKFGGTRSPKPRRLG